MRVIKPLPVNDARLASSSIPEPDASVGEVEWSAYTSAIGDRRISVTTHRVYEAVTVNTDNPTTGISLVPPSWVDVEPTNRWAMFDNLNSTKSLISTQLIVEFTPGQLTNSVAGFSVEGAGAINVTMTDPSAGIVYNHDLDLVDNSEVADWYFYWNTPVIRASEFVLLDLPTYPSATIKITIDGGSIAFGSVIFGAVIDLGVANYGTSVQLLDFSKKERDSFGNITVTPGRTSKLVSFDVTVPTDKVNYVYKQIALLTTTPSVWVGDDGSDDPTLVFGYYRDYQNNISTPTISDATIKIEGL